MMEQTKEPFNPKEKLTPLAFRGKTVDYLEVKYRVMWFRDTFPKGEILTELLHLDEKRAVVHARVLADGAMLGNGLGSETVGDWTDYIEKAETKAIGRALAVAGFGTQFCVELDMELPNGEEKIIDTPIETKRTPASAPRQIHQSPITERQSGDRPMSDKQKGFIERLCTRHSVDPNILAQTWYSTAFDTITLPQANDMIKKLQGGQASTELDSEPSDGSPY